jgi:hypothetical protein
MNPMGKDENCSQRGLQKVIHGYNVVISLNSRGAINSGGGGEPPPIRK